MLTKPTSPSYQSWLPGIASSSGRGVGGSGGDTARIGASSRASYSAMLPAG
nr:hypothetical protein [Deltaproteobacteria bacterium]